MNFKVKINILVVLIFVSNVSFSQNNKATSAYEFLRNESSSRAAALGGSFVCFAEDPNIIFYNPAGISSCYQKQVSLGFLKHLLDVNGGYASYVQYLDIVGGWIGGGIQYVNYGSFDQTDNIGNITGEFSVGDLALSLGYARKNQDNLSYGANIKIIYSSIAGNSSMALAGDFGIFYTIPEQMINIGASILSLGTQIASYSNLNENLPIDVKIGISKTLEHLPLNINLNFHRLNFSYDNFFERFKSFSIGGEFTLSKFVKFRIGYNNERRLDLKLGTSAGLAGFSLGFGLLISNYNLDYAFSSYGKVGELHRLNISTSF